MEGESGAPGRRAPPAPALGWVPPVYVRAVGHEVVLEGLKVYSSDGEPSRGLEQALA